jgi:hypothetical protein
LESYFLTAEWKLDFFENERALLGYPKEKSTSFNFTHFRFDVLPSVKEQNQRFYSNNI